MKIKQIGAYNGDIIETTLRNRGITDTQLLYNPNSDNDVDPAKFAFIEEGLKVVASHLLVGNKIGILVDSDADGFSSAAIMYKYIKALEPTADLEYFLHAGKGHGLTSEIMDKLSESTIDLLIIPDAASNNSRELGILAMCGVDIVIIDHHEVDQLPDAGIVINNQLEENEETNKNLVGAGMVLKFCQYFDNTFENNYAEDLHDLAAIGQVGDQSDLSENEVRNIVFKGLKNIKSEFIKAVLTDNFGSYENITPNDLSFSIIPFINAITRVGSVEEREILFKAMADIDKDELLTVKKKKKNKDTGKFDTLEIVQTYGEYAVDVCKRVKTRQASLVKKTMASLASNINNDGGIVIGTIDSEEQRSLSGLVANKMVGKYQKPALLLFSGEKEFVGSGRGYEKVLPSLKDWCNNTQLVNFASGHANAFGISIPTKQLDSFLEATATIESKDEPVYEVDLIVNGRSDKSMIFEIAENKFLFGNGVKEPLLAFTNIDCDKRYIRQRGSMLTFFDSGVEYVMFSAPDGFFEELTYGFSQFIRMDFVGKARINTWGNKTTPQIIIEECERSTEEIRENTNTNEVTAESLVF